MEGLDEFTQVSSVGNGIPTVVTGKLVGRIRHQSNLLGHNVKDKTHKVRRRVPLDIKFGCYQFAQSIDVAATYMSFIGTRMDGNALSTEAFAVNGKALYIRQIAPARVTQSGYLINIYTQSSHKFRAKLVLFFDMCKKKCTFAGKFRKSMTIAIFGNSQKSLIKEEVSHLLDFFQRRGVDVILSHELRQELNLREY
jgi:hypothetical protein